MHRPHRPWKKASTNLSFSSKVRAPGRDRPRQKTSRQTARAGENDTIADCGRSRNRLQSRTGGRYLQMMAQMTHILRLSRTLKAILGIAALAGCLSGCNSQDPQAAAPPSRIDLTTPPADPPPPPPYVPRPKDSLVFAKDVAPIVFQKCATCHHAGEIGPFPLVSYADVKNRTSRSWN